MPLFDPSEVQYYAAHMPHIENPGWFRHTPPSDKPEPPDFPDTLNDAEQAEVNAWLADHTAVPSLADAIIKTAEYELFYNLLAVWNDANEIEKMTQFRHRLARAMVANTSTVPASDSISGNGAGAVVPPGSP